MAVNKYYREELDFLTREGKEFAQIYPQLTRFLDGKVVDPDVARLLEGFAFLTGKLREKIEDEFPELTHSMINMLWPNYLRPVPSMTIMQFAARDRAIDQGHEVAKGTQVDSIAVQGTQCRFRTCRPIKVYPLATQNVDVSYSRDISILDITLDVLTKQPLNALGLDTLRFYLGGCDYNAQTLSLWLSHHLESFELVIDGTHFSLDKSTVKMVGFDRQDAILPYPANAYEGYRIIQEYLTFPKAFSFFDVGSLAAALPPAARDKIALRFTFNKTLPADARIALDDFQLHCTPAINLFSHSADPIDLDGKLTQQRIAPSSQYPSHYEVFSVDKVQGWLLDTDGRVRGKPRIYCAFESFQHDIERARARSSLYYRLRVKDSIRNDGFDHFVSFVRDDETLCINKNETISLDLTCSNRQLPLALGIGDICLESDNTPAFVEFRNITVPTATQRPVLDGSLLWTLISNLSLNYLSLLSKDALQSVLRAYDFRALVDRQAEKIAKQRLNGVVAIETQPTDRIYKGVAVRGLKTRLSLKQSCFACEGDLYLFGALLSQFFSLYASINSFHELEVLNVDNQELYKWNAQAGQQPLI
ncbi:MULTISPECIES: type VI secretion system baseplate subunit TssF [unclassified Motilimonas]|uniref:type VI secretion system baseplate subunit TssF n=1 Tax=unclassified Motilimonas TaxID=2643697 RepID=UPI001E50BCD0|nr:MULTISPECIES: type VI secretion system baseplate subunit TssF [unclassified Motilimonas]MCE0559218.1 type VI secretion system baseplate subunit TssF [Motilimonas sp. E26]MDO6527521.1 type VI secretion system baseplate subunit TssF [Motilimonas sp. 1_MG-2023]